MIPRAGEKGRGLTRLLMKTDMLSVFFDLETTDKNPIGQIINFCFMAVDEHWNVRSSLCDDIRISRLELPRPAAILANRTNVLEHQARAVLTEAAAMKRIAEYLHSVIDESPGRRAALIGYNSSRFDLTFLRTSLIRNGINPYFDGRLLYRDLLHTVRRAACRRSRFPRTANGEDPSLLSLSLESISKSLGLLDGSQKHHSRADVELTISLAGHLSREFDCDVRSDEAYQVPKQIRPGSVMWEMVPNYDMSRPEQAVERPMLLLDDNYRYALWVQLDRYLAGEGRKAVCWCNKNQASFIAASPRELGPELQEAAEKAKKEFSGLSLKNFFERSSCDIEQDIYRLDYEAIEALGRAIWQNDESLLKKLQGRDGQVLYLRHRLRHYEWGGAQDERMRGILKKYALHRYGGKLQLRKVLSEDVKDEAFHPTCADLIRDLEGRLACAAPEDRVLLDALREFYLGSEIYQAAGDRLSTGEESAPVGISRQGAV